MPPDLRTVKSFCRFCHVFCGIEVDVDPEASRVLAVRGDRENPFSRGYTCAKGRAAGLEVDHPERLLTARRRGADGWTDVALEQALDEVAGRLSAIAGRHGPRSVAAYMGTGEAFSAAGWPLAKAWLDALGSPSLYTALTVDKPGIIVAAQRFFGSAATPLGTYAGVFDIDHADVAMFVGTNPVVSHGVAMPFSYPAKRLRDAKARGMKLIVVDPRRSETAKRADIHLQVKPGEDASLLAGMIRLILECGLHDGEYVRRHVSGVEELRVAVSDFDLEYVALRTGVPAELVERATATFASASTGAARLGVGISMARHQNLTIHLVHALNALCGRVDRKGGLVFNPGVLSRPLAPGLRPVPQPLHAEASSRVRGLRGLQVAPGWVEMPSAALADEILDPGEGRVRALLVLRGNPALSFPDQAKTVRAMRSLDLLAVVDTSMTATARLAHYVLPPRHYLERPDATLMFDRFYPAQFAQYTPAVVRGPDGLLEDWEILWELARRMGLALALPGIAMDRRPTSDDVLNALTAGSRMPLEEVRKYPSGHVFGGTLAGSVVPGGIAHRDGKMAAGHPDAMAELRAVRAEPCLEREVGGEARPFTHRLVSMHDRDLYNTAGSRLGSVKAGRDGGLAFLNPADLQAFGLTSGDAALLDSGHGRLPVTVESTTDVEPGVVAMSFGWELSAEHDEQPGVAGAAVTRLIPNAERFDPITGMAQQTAVPVNLYPVRPAQRRR